MAARSYMLAAPEQSLDSTLSSLFASSSDQSVPVLGPRHVPAAGVEHAGSDLIPSGGAAHPSDQLTVDLSSDNAGPKTLRSRERAGNREALVGSKVERQLRPKGATASRDKKRKLEKEHSSDDGKSRSQRPLEEEPTPLKRRKAESPSLSESPLRSPREDTGLVPLDEEPALRHETLLEEADLPAATEATARTVFLGNVSTEAILSRSSRKALLQHISGSDDGDSAGSHAVETLRFRSVPFSSTSMPKRAAFITKSLMSSTAKSCNAYAVFSNVAAAKEAVSRLNGTVVLGRHLHVDSAANPTAIDPRRCVFVGNLNFVDDEGAPDEEVDDEGKSMRKKRKRADIPADVEEGLWRTFGAEVGQVESVRVVRDQVTRVGKGFAYVQFYNENDVEAALHLSGKKFPPMLPRKLRVSRCKPRGRVPSAKAANVPERMQRSSRRAKDSGNGRIRQTQSSKRPSQAKTGSADGLLFEGHRATGKERASTGSKSKSRNAVRERKKAGKPLGRGARRAAEWKRTGKPKQ